MATILERDGKPDYVVVDLLSAGAGVAGSNVFGTAVDFSTQLAQPIDCNEGVWLMALSSVDLRLSSTSLSCVVHSDIQLPVAMAGKSAQVLARVSPQTDHTVGDILTFVPQSPVVRWVPVMPGTHRSIRVALYDSTGAAWGLVVGQYTNVTLVLRRVS